MRKILRPHSDQTFLSPLLPSPPNASNVRDKRNCLLDKNNTIRPYPPSERNGSIIRRANKIEQKYPLDGDTYIQLQSNRFKRLKPSDPLVRINLHGPRSPNLQFSSFVPAVREKYEGIRYAYSSRKLTLITDRVENRFRTEMN